MRQPVLSRGALNINGVWMKRKNALKSNSNQQPSDTRWLTAAARNSSKLPLQLHQKEQHSGTHVISSSSSGSSTLYIKTYYRVARWTWGDARLTIFNCTSWTSYPINEIQIHKRVRRITQLAKLGINHSIGRTHSWRSCHNFLKVFHHRCTGVV